MTNENFFITKISFSWENLPCNIKSDTDVEKKKTQLSLAKIKNGAPIISTAALLKKLPNS